MPDLPFVSCRRTRAEFGSPYMLVPFRAAGEHSPKAVKEKGRRSMPHAYIAEIIEYIQGGYPSEVMFVGSSPEKALGYIRENPHASSESCWCRMTYAHELDNPHSAAISGVRWYLECLAGFLLVGISLAHGFQACTPSLIGERFRHIAEFFDYFLIGKTTSTHG